MNETGSSIRGNRRKPSVDDGEYGNEDNAMARGRKHHRPAMVLMGEEDPQVLTRVVDMEVVLRSRISQHKTVLCCIRGNIGRISPYVN